MNLDDAIVLETFSSRIEAEMAAGLLESEGVPAMVLADDAGGAYPMLQFIRGVRLMVAGEDQYRAREILRDMAEPVEPPEEPSSFTSWGPILGAVQPPLQKLPLWELGVGFKSMNKGPALGLTSFLGLFFWLSLCFARGLVRLPLPSGRVVRPNWSNQPIPLLPGSSARFGLFSMFLMAVAAWLVRRRREACADLW